MGILKNIKTKISAKDEEASSKETGLKQEKKVSKKPKVASKADKVVDTKTVSEVLIRPILTEKSTRLTEKKQYVFEILQTANKVQVAKAVKETYGVTPVSVRVMNFRGKAVRFGRFQGRRKGFKKAIVTLNPKDSIEIFEGV